MDTLQFLLIIAAITNFKVRNIKESFKQNFNGFRGKCTLKEVSVSVMQGKIADS
jgi:hypothetical protein